MDPESQASRFPRLLAAVMAAVLAVAVVLALVTGEVYSGVRTQNWIDRDTAPGHYWAFMAFSSLGMLLLAAVALGFVGTDHDSAGWQQRKHKRRRDGTIFALVCLLLAAGTWANERWQFGATPQDAVLGFFLLGVFGFVIVLAPLPRGASGAWLRTAAGALIVIAAAGMSLV
jgi:hypothetical protein